MKTSHHRKRLILDRSELGRVPEGYRVISSEVDFLRTALRDDRQVVRGETLCRWAEDFWRARGWEYDEISSPIHDLRGACPDLTDSQAAELLQALGERFWSLPPGFSVADLLRLAMPSGPWNSGPSPEHAAAWLIWLEEATVPPYVEPLITFQAAKWELESELKYKQVYRCTQPAESTELLAIWLGVEQRDGNEDLGTFPIDVPQRWQEKAREKWRRDIVSSGAGAFDTVPASNLPTCIKKIAADEVCNYYIHHPDKLSQTLINNLEPFLPPDRAKKLRSLLPPDRPPNAPRQLDELQDWFVNCYLPYREWQVDSKDENAEVIVHNIAADL